MKDKGGDPDRNLDVKDTYRVTIKERYKVRLHCDPIKSPGEFLSLLEAHQM